MPFAACNSGNFPVHPGMLVNSSQATSGPSGSAQVTPSVTPVLPSIDWIDSAIPATAPKPAVSGEVHLAVADLIRRFIQVIVAFFCLFLLVRTIALEPYGVPTGSMAESLIGNHREAICPRCGFPLRVGEPNREGRSNRSFISSCPNCAARVDLSESPEVPGDRVLVDKNCFELRSPRRWEIAVFRCPVDSSKPYVKRVVGLPGEFVQIRDGDLYIDGELSRKSLAQIRETRVLFFDMNYLPVPDGWSCRWLIEVGTGPNSTVADELLPHPSPASPDLISQNSIIVDGKTLRFEATASPEAAVGVTYRHFHLDLQEDQPVRDWLDYNGLPPETGRFRPVQVVMPAVHDFIVECDLELLAGPGLFSCRLGDGGDHVTADIPIGQGPGRYRVTGQAEVERGKIAPPPVSIDATAASLEPGRSYHLEFAFVDRRATLAIDGHVIVPVLDLPAKFRRGAVRRPLQFGIRGAALAIHNLKLYHDIHYRAEGRNGIDLPFRLGANEYFMLGDNSADSHDSREWSIAGVPEENFIGKPFLIHQPLRLVRWRINGRDRTFQSVDWTRLRWLR